MKCNKWHFILWYCFLSIAISASHTSREWPGPKATQLTPQRRVSAYKHGYYIKKCSRELSVHNSRGATLHCKCIAYAVGNFDTATSPLSIGAIQCLGMHEQSLHIRSTVIIHIYGSRFESSCAEGVRQCQNLLAVMGQHLGETVHLTTLSPFPQTRCACPFDTTRVLQLTC